uniref:Uncharacterized protein n=1 Tax=Tanacetum cinerariifolium TaxID=118510 RepID=A0A699KMR4_TANCI|nr:hypothetical protein [Tanacetum cinerariifolium]
MRRVGKGFSGVETPLFEGMIADRQPAEEELGAEQVLVDVAIDAAVVEDVTEDVAHMDTPSPPPYGILSSPQEPSSHPHQPPCPPQPQDAEVPFILFQQVLDTCSALARRVEGLENDKAAQQLEIVKLKARVKKLEKIHMVKSSKLRRLKKVGTSQRVESSDDMENVFNQGRKIADMDQDEGIELAIAASTPIPAANPKILNIVAAPAVSTSRRERVVIRDPEEELPSDTPTKTSQKPQYIKRYHGMKKKPQTESEARKNMIFYLNNTEGYKMDFFKGMKYDEILPIFQAKFDANMRFLFKSREEMEEEDQEIIKSINKTPAQKATKRRKLSEEAQEAEDLRKRLEVVED